MGTSSSSADRVAELAELLRKYKDAYYNGQALVSDAAYDALEDELRALEPEHAILKSVGAPVNEVVTEWEKARHAIPMGSLNKAVNEAEFRQWVARCDQLGVESALVPIANDLLVTEKLDGLSLAVNYENGKLVEAITRGDGQVGERITSNARRMKGVPARLPGPLRVSLRGEIILKLPDMKIGFPGPDAPPRNRAAGTSKRFDGARGEDLTVMFYHLEGGDTEHATEKEKYERLLQLGLIVPPFEVTDLEGALRIHNEYSSKKRAELDYEIDGLVVRANDLRAQHLLGELGGRPRAAVAYKFASLAKVSRVIAINWPSAATRRAGAPGVAALGGRGESLVCPTLRCRAIVGGRTRRWVGTQDILEWGDRLIAQLVEAQLVREPADLYRLTIDDIAGLERRGATIAKKVLDNLKAKLPLSLPVFLGSLGMDDFALETAKLLVANGFDTLEKVQAATAEELAALKGMGAIKAKSVVTGLAARSEEIQRLLAVGVVPVAPSAGGGLAGKTCCFTGTLPPPVEKHGGTVLSGVTKELHYLVMSDPSSASTKAEKARKYGTQCIDSDAFMTLVDAASSSAADV